MIKGNEQIFSLLFCWVRLCVLSRHFQRPCVQQQLRPPSPQLSGRCSARRVTTCHGTNRPRANDRNSSLEDCRPIKGKLTDAYVRNAAPLSVFFFPLPTYLVECFEEQDVSAGLLQSAALHVCFRVNHSGLRVLVLLIRVERLRAHCVSEEWWRGVQTLHSPVFRLTAGPIVARLLATIHKHTQGRGELKVLLA